ncbi:hypothetical protein BV22DRAFT_1044862 [Leucogyrophana mollusca]|uniref:Uncharacterized protein n=1 Tax=Leucogyrophana mollusca TaxID=85980 RepID=A0ACB8BTL8_9AGAM|nr:hypothetical protein BV22DRAFT_1044862 [Leucogyrophana mollusca]
MFLGLTTRRAGRKRTADETAEKRETRSGGSAKVAKTESTKSPKNAGKQAKGAARLKVGRWPPSYSYAAAHAAPKTSMSTTAFKARALPLHVNITHTPPSIPDDESVPVAQVDPGFVGTTSLVPSSFATGSFGWKGNKRLTIELPGQEGGEKETVHVMLTINATVIGSKDAKDDGEEGKEEETEKAEEEPKKPDEAENGETTQEEAVKDQEEVAPTEEKGEGEDNVEAAP